MIQNSVAQAECIQSFAQAEELLLASELPREIFGIHGTYSGLRDRYTVSDWGRHQAEQDPRFYANFGYGQLERTPSGLLVHSMVQDLGDRVHPVDHNLAAHNDFVGYVLGLVLQNATHKRPPLDLSPFELASTRFAILYHDTGESTHADLRRICGRVIGDIPHGKKTAEDRAAERLLLHAVLNKNCPDVADPVKELALNLITHDTSIEGSFAHLAYEDSHLWGELDTSLLAGRLALAAIAEGRQSETRTIQLTRLATEVSQRVWPLVEATTTVFPLTTVMLDKRVPEYERIQREFAA